jgi:endonuclease/exonuclease/phosphatase family metal-dependent hydrolase
MNEGRLATVPRILLIILGVFWSGAVSAAGCNGDEALPEVIEGETLRVATLNIAHARGTAINQLFVGRGRMEGNLDAVARLLAAERVDVVALQELDVDSLWSGQFDHAARLMNGSGLRCAALGMHAQTWLYRFGTGLLSGTPLHRPQVVDFESTPPRTTKGFVAATIRWRHNGRVRPVRLVSVHLDFLRKSARDRQLDVLVNLAQNAMRPLVIMGDFNEGWGGEDSVVRALVEKAGMVVFQPKSADLATYKSDRLDWILISSELEFSGYRVSDEVVSDHLMVIAELRWKDRQ